MKEIYTETPYQLFKLLYLYINFPQLFYTNSN